MHEKRMKLGRPAYGTCIIHDRLSSLRLELSLNSTALHLRFGSAFFKFENPQIRSQRFVLILCQYLPGVNLRSPCPTTYVHLA